MKNKISLLFAVVVAVLVAFASDVMAQLSSPTLTITNASMVQDFVDDGVAMVNWGIVGTIVIVSLLLIIGLVISVYRWLKGRRAS